MATTTMEGGAFSQERTTGPVVTKKGPHELWQLHGKFYDFTDFVNKHPGGVEMIKLGKGRDCTELFESSHSLSSNIPFSILSRYEVLVLKEEPVSVPTGKLGERSSSSSSLDGSDSEEESSSSGRGEVQQPAQPEYLEGNPDLFTWKPEDGGSGFYFELTRRVKEFVKKEPSMLGYYKATRWFYTKVFVSALLYMYLFYQAFYAPMMSNKVTYFFAAQAGFALETVLFMSMHDGSHGALAKGKWSGVNWFFGSLVNIGFWDLWLWLRHHCYGHHSYTGIYRKDPDLTNSKVFLRKHHQTPWQPVHRWQHVVTWLWLMVLPNQHIGQAFVYVTSWAKRKLFGIPLDIENAPLNIPKYLVYALSVTLHFILPLVLGTRTFSQLFVAQFFYWTFAGINYFLVTVPNHDTEEVSDSLHTPKIIETRNEKGEIVEKKVVKVDWGEMQARNSSNHSLGGGFLSTIVTELWGGMNYQIEHHLFPSMCHEHYAKIAPIVKQTCAEYGIPYNNAGSWFGAVVSYARHIRKLAQKPKEN